MDLQNTEWQPGQGPRTAESGHWFMNYLQSIDNFKDFFIYYDHGDSRLPNVAEIKGFYGETVGRNNRLTDVDILVAKPNGEILFLIEIEETPNCPQKYIGTIFSILMCNSFAVSKGKGQQYFHTTEDSKLIIAGTVPTQRRLRKLYDIVHPGIARFTTQEVMSINPKNVIFVFSDKIDSTMEMVRETVKDLLQGASPEDLKPKIEDMCLTTKTHVTQSNNICGSLDMNDNWINLNPWNDFSHEIEERCDSIVKCVVKKIESVINNTKKYNGSYSFIALIKGHSKTSAKLFPQHWNTESVILAAFSSPLPDAEIYAKQFNSKVEKAEIMHEPFYVSRIPDEWCFERVAEIIAKFLSQFPPAGRRKMLL